MASCDMAGTIHESLVLGSGAKAAAHSTVVCQSSEEDAPAGGWPTVNDAQNAAAAGALFQVLGAGPLTPLLSASTALVFATDTLQPP
jgi:hypothetical protein